MIEYFIFAILFDNLNAVYLYDYVDPHPRPTRLSASNELEFEPIVPPIDEMDQEKITFLKNINCDDYPKYVLNCTVEAAMMYNSSRKAPPLPEKMNDWCKAIRHLTNCAIDWNADCKDVTESHFNDESIRGHMHVVAKICDDEWFLSRYDQLTYCVNNAAKAWEECYAIFKAVTDEQKNTTHEWTHYETHFELCCARTLFRRCTLNALFDKPSACSYEQSVTLQKFSVIVSEGDVYQDCEHNMMYSNCPGGDPRPSVRALSKLMNADAFNGSSVVRDMFLFNIVPCFVIVLYFIYEITGSFILP